jgi:hypothetical protein
MMTAHPAFGPQPILPQCRISLLRRTLQRHRILPLHRISRQHHGLQPHRILPPRRLAARGAVRPASTGNCTFLFCKFVLLVDADNSGE